jgi:hypothetical protein
VIDRTSAAATYFKVLNQWNGAPIVGRPITVDRAFTMLNDAQSKVHPGCSLFAKIDRLRHDIIYNQKDTQDPEAATA